MCKGITGRGGMLHVVEVALIAAVPQNVSMRATCTACGNGEDLDMHCTVG